MTQKKNTLKTLLLALVCTTAVGLSATSCIGDDDDNNNSFTAEQVGQCLRTVRGTYTGKLVYAAQNPDVASDTSDTLAITWTVNADTTLTIHNFPSERLAENVSDPTLKAALQEAGPRDITAYIGFYKTSPVCFLLNPLPLQYTLTYGEEQNLKVTVAFYINTSSSVGIYSSTDKRFELQIIEGGVYVGDDTSVNKLNSNGTVFYLYTENLLGV